MREKQSNGEIMEPRGVEEETQREIKEAERLNQEKEEEEEAERLSSKREYE